MSQKKSIKLLIIRFSAFGDVVQSLSIPAAVKEKYPDADVQWVTREDFSGLLTGHKDISKVWKFNKKLGFGGLISLALQMRSENFSHIYDAHNNLRSHMITWILRPWGPFSTVLFIRRSIRRWRRFLLFRLRINLFEQPFSGQRDLLEPLQKWGISKWPPPAPQLFLDSSVQSQAQGLLPGFENSVALAPSAAHLLKRWPVEYWAELIRLSPQKKFVLLGGPDDHFLSEIVVADPARVLNLAGKCSLTVSSAIIGKLPVLISNDTGLLHVAEQLGKPAIALMGPAPFGFPCREKTVILQRDLQCRPCSKHGQGPCVNKKYYHECLRDISAAEVTKTLNLILDNENTRRFSESAKSPIKGES